MTMAEVTFVAHHPEFASIIGDSPTSKLLAETDTTTREPLFHEACVYHAPTQSVFVTSNQLSSQDSSIHPTGKYIRLSQIHDGIPDGPSSGKARVDDVTPPSLARSMLNGGVNFTGDTLLVCAQGSTVDEDHSGLIILSAKDATQDKPADLDVKPLVTSYHGNAFNSVNDVIVHPVDGSVWFTDPCYGFHQGIRPVPQLPDQVYRFDPATGSIRAIADGFTRPNGLCFSPDLKTLYVTDTGAIHGSSAVPLNPAGPSHIHAFDIIERDQGIFLANRRLFAHAPGRLPDGIKCDTRGNVYAGCMDGVEVWNKQGVLIGVIQVPGGVANFCFGEKGAMYLCNETRFWKVQLAGLDVRGALLGI
ncbi:hypothetical protein BDZ85DRAFT_254454 [Elsinoe ampelina]|uniref:SMP-30/Gluconolactonase/LRE-like region domain-containing protein n=1 Tax=Elsinoe ampelina TaxID=302913 RepID=A0A6A6GPW2_9PEZI|nr:hypothetical protein BDZ85DRAFT_254454 [Elsinoe ampelina]